MWNETFSPCNIKDSEKSTAHTGFEPARSLVYYSSTSYFIYLHHVLRSYETVLYCDDIMGTFPSECFQRNKDFYLQTHDHDTTNTDQRLQRKEVPGSKSGQVIMTFLPLSSLFLSLLSSFFSKENKGRHNKWGKEKRCQPLQDIYKG